MKANRLLTILLLTIVSVSVGIVLSGAALDASAQHSGAMANDQMDMSAGIKDMLAQAGSNPTASTQAFVQNAAKMMIDIRAVPYTGDADVDFVTHMIAHHHGAMEQAEVELKYGKDPQMRALAENIIHSQRLEIAYMKQWLANHNIMR
jgi:uncharacterized protein (DUF305 family)